MSSLVDPISRLASPWAYVLVALLAALEASAFVGLVVPGELALLTGGFVARQGHAELGVMIVVAVLAGVVGDSAGFELGRRLGPGLRTSRLGRRIGDRRWDRAAAYLKSHGGRAVFLGRFVGVLRALVPALAGASRMRYRRFLPWNVAGALVWGPAMVVLGYLAGSSYRRVEQDVGTAGLVVLLVAAVTGVLVHLAFRHRPSRA